jgi:hypothetical protein
VGHKSPADKNRKSLVEHGSGMKKKPNKLRPSKSDGDLLNFYDDDVMSDDAKLCLSITDDNGLSFENSDEDDAFGFAKWQSAPVETKKSFRDPIGPQFSKYEAKIVSIPSVHKRKCTENYGYKKEGNGNAPKCVDSFVIIFDLLKTFLPCCF